MVKLLIETGNESHSSGSHTSSWQRCQAQFAGGPNDGAHLYTAKAAIMSTEWPVGGKHAHVAKTVYNLPNGTEILIDYKGHEGPEKFIIRLDESQEVKEYEIGTSRLRTYTMKGRYIVVRDLIKEAKEAVRQAQEEGF
jgi:hypothetical protein